jgi:LysM repeat protein
VLAVVVAMDARNRGMSPTLWGGLTVILSVFGALAYLVSRPVERFEEVVVDAHGEADSLEHAMAPAPSGSLWAREHSQPPPQEQLSAAPFRPEAAYDEGDEEPDEGWRPAGRTWLYVGAVAFLGLVLVGALVAYVASSGSTETPRRTLPTLAPTVAAAPSPTQDASGPLLAPTPTAESDEAPPAVPSATALVADETYTVQEGDTLNGIANSYGISVEELIAANDLGNETIQVGQRLIIPRRTQ